MPRYFFHVQDGRSPHRDDYGDQLPDLAAAKEEAVRASAEMLRGWPSSLHDGEWRMMVTDAHHTELLLVVFSVTVLPGAEASLSGEMTKAQDSDPRALRHGEPPHQTDGP